eukprot:6161529-Pyramimonas_sp.AAC.1
MAELDNNAVERGAMLTDAEAPNIEPASPRGSVCWEVGFCTCTDEGQRKLNMMNAFVVTCFKHHYPA